MEELKEKTEVDYTGVITAAVLLPIALIVYHFGDADMAVSTFLSLGIVIFAAVIKWSLRQYVWFWITLLIVAALHAPIIFGLHLPAHWIHGVVLLPVCIVDLLIVLGIIRGVEKIMLATSPK